MQPKALSVMTALLMALAAFSAAGESLWPANGGSLFADNKAFRVGDVVTVIVNENATTSTAQANTLSKTSATDASVDTFVVPSGKTSTTKFFSQETPAVVLDNTRTFDGSGTHTTADSVQTSITATVREVLPNGYLVVEGSRMREIMNEKVEIRISGIVRPIDITTSNTVVSSSLAEARILMTSSGSVARSAKRGWFDRFLDYIWPF
jgi:flagellar L-ring protein precursor FlgH